MLNDRSLRSIILLWPWLLAALVHAGAGTELWYDAPAEDVSAVLPIGNGRLCATVDGGVAVATLRLSDRALWSGSTPPAGDEDLAPALAEARHHFLAGRDVEGRRVVRERRLTGSHAARRAEPLGTLALRFDHGGAAPEAYRRDLDLDTAIARTRYTAGDTRYTRAAFVSALDDVLVVRIEADRPGRIEFHLTLDRPYGFMRHTPSDERLVMTGRAGGAAAPGVPYATVVEIAVEGGMVRAEGDGLRVAGADAATVYLASATGDAGADPIAVCDATLAAARRRSFASVRDDHLAVHRRLFRRVEVDLGDGSASPTDVRLRRFRAGVDDPALAALFFQLGRYLLISASRPGTNALGWSGPWCDDRDARPGAGPGLPMGYWPAEVVNLAECHEPLLALADDWRQPGRAMAHRLGCRGVALAVPVDGWRSAAAPAPLTSILGAGVLVDHLLAHARFRGDGRFFAARADPFLREAGVFYVDWLVQEPGTGRLLSGPRDAGGGRFVMGSSLDQHVIAATFDAVSASIARGDGGGDDLTDAVTGAIGRLAIPGVDADGRLAASVGDGPGAGPDGRFPVHLYGLYPGAQITPRRTPALARAARASLDAANVGDGDQPGWAHAWMIGLGGRLDDAAFALAHLRRLLAESIGPNLLGVEPAGRIDANLGATAGMAELFVQSHEAAIDILPALPAAWPTGFVRGLCAKGGFEVDVIWEDGTFVEVEVRSRRGGPCSVRSGDRTISFATEPGGTYVLFGDDFQTTE